MQKFKRILVLVAVFVLAFSSPLMSLQAAAAKVNVDKISTVSLGEKGIVSQELIETDSPNKKVRVIVELESKPAIIEATEQGVLFKELSASARNKIEQNLKAEQQDVQAQISKVVPSIEYLQTFTTVLNGFSTEITAKQAEVIAKIDGVKAIYTSNEYERPEVEKNMITSNDLVQAQQAWRDYGYKGEGMIVGVIDSGTDVDHKDFIITDETKVALTKEAVEAEVAKGTIAKGKYYNAKVPFAYNYMDDNNIVEDLGPGASMHGMHVAGTVAANGDLEKGGIKGVAPEAQILGLKVFGNDPGFGSTFGDVYVKAIDDAIILGADVLNLSLGSIAGFVDSNSPEQKAINNATENGIVVAISAGNSDQLGSGYYYPYASNQDYGVTGSPSVSTNSLGVASFENTHITGSAFDTYIGEDASVKMFYSLANGNNPAKSLSGKYDVVYGGFGTAPEIKDAKGKVVIVSRGNGVNFVDKGKNAQAAGAVAVIIHNNVEGSINMASDASITIPYMSSLQNDGIKIKEAIDAGVKVQIQFAGNTINLENPSSGSMSDFTSWGPAPNLDFKPEITAPGGEIYSTFNNDEYGLMSGTSMASPHVAGAAAIVLQRVDAEFGLTHIERVELARTLLMNTALPVETADGVYESPRRQGAGLMQIANALETEVYVRESVTKQGKVALKEIQDNKFTFTLELTNVSDKAKTFAVDLQLQSDTPVNNNGDIITAPNLIPAYVYKVAGEEPDYTAEFANKVTIPANATESVTFSVDVKDSTWLLAALTNGYFVDGFVKFTDVDENNPDLVVPFFGYNGKWDAAPIFDAFRWDPTTYYGMTYLIDGRTYGNVTGTASTSQFNPTNFGFSPNGDGTKDTILPVFSLMRNAKEMKVQVTDANGKVLRTIHQVSNYTKNYTSSSTVNPYKLSSAFTWDGKVNGKVVKDGQYNIRLTAVVDYPGAKWQVVDIPLKVDTQGPTADITYNQATNALNFANFGDKGVGYNNYQILVNNRSVRTGTGTIASYTLPALNKNDIVTVRLTDLVGNVSTINVPLEKTEPVINLTSPSYLGSYSSNQVRVAGTVVDDSTITSIKVNGISTTIGANNAFSHTLTLESGVHNIKVEATDIYGNVMSIQRKVIVDTEKPQLAVTAPETTTAEVLEITANVKDNFDEAYVYVNDSLVYKQDFDEPYAMRAIDLDVAIELELELGVNTFEVEVVDVLGHSATQTITIERTEKVQTEDGEVAPVVPVTNIVEGETSSSLTIVTEEDANVVTLSASDVALVKGYEKPFNLVVNDTVITFPTKVIDQLAAISADEVVIDVKVNETFADIKNVVDVTVSTVTADEKSAVTKFDAKVSVSVPAEVKNADKVAAFYINEETKALTYVQSTYADGTVTFKTNHFSKFVVQENETTFGDIQNKRWAVKAIESLAAKKIVNGTSAANFSPDNKVSRQQFAAFIVRALDIETSEYEGIFTDVKEDDRFALEIEAAYKAGIISGNKGKFNGSGEITRQAMATIVVNALEYNAPGSTADVTSSVTFADEASIAKFAKANVNIAVGLEIINGKTSSKGLSFAPTATASRAEAAVVIYNLLKNLK